MLIKFLVFFFKILFGENNNFPESRLRYIFRQNKYVITVKDTKFIFPYFNFKVRFKAYMLFYYYYLFLLLLFICIV
jgi:hypothetical protein